MELKRAEKYLGREKATKHVLYLARSLKIKTPKPRFYNEDIILNNEHKKFRLNIEEEILHTMNHGRAKMLQGWFDANDRFLNPIIEMSTSGSTSGINFKLGATLGNFKASVSNHGALEAPELALTRDISYFHKKTCELYNSGDIPGFSRSFRGFLHSCISLVDCFLFRYAFHIREIIPDPTLYINTLTLDSRASVMDRLEAWMLTFANKNIESFKEWPERSQFVELKTKRNEFTHPSVPAVIFDPVDVARHLNYGASGVGKLMGKMRQASSVSDRIGFIHQVSHLPKVTVNKQNSKK